jgi:NAD(P)-dependent dehydrogenase (short-subunit alcohol dehydrogenase family)
MGFCRQLVANATKGPGRLDILVSNAWRQQEFPQITDMPDE